MQIWLKPYGGRYLLANPEPYDKVKWLTSGVLFSLIFHVAVVFSLVYALQHHRPPDTTANQIEVNLTPLPTPMLNRLGDIPTPPVALPRPPRVNVNPVKTPPQIEPQKQINPMEVPKQLKTPVKFEQKNPLVPPVKVKLEKVQLKPQEVPEIKEDLRKPVKPVELAEQAVAPIKVQPTKPIMPVDVKVPLKANVKPMKYSSMRVHPKRTTKPVKVASAAHLFPVSYKLVIKTPARSATGSSLSGKQAKSSINYSVLALYKSLIRKKIEEHKEYPEWARENGLEGKVWLEFTLLKNGKIVGLKIVKSSDYGVLDRAALNSVEAAAPFPPFPKGINRNRLNIRLLVRFKLQEG